MADKTTFKTRIVNKHDTYANWQANSDVVLLAGEIAIVEIPGGTEVTSEGIQAKPPMTLIKIGDGEHKFSELSYLTAKSGDVYDWAREAQKPTYKASEITGLDDAISSKITETIEDTDTQYKLVADTSKLEDEHKVTLKLQSKTKDGEAFADTSDPAIELTFYDDTKIKADIAELQTKVGEQNVETAISTAIEEAKGELTTQINAKASQEDLETANGKITKLEGILGEDAESEGLQKDVADLKKTAAALDTTYAKATHSHTASEITDLQDKLDEKASEEDMTKAKADITALQGQIKGVSGAMHFKGVVKTNPTELEDVSTYENGDVVAFENKEYVFVKPGPEPESKEEGEFVELGDTTATDEKVSTLEGRVGTVEAKANANETKLTGISNTVTEYVTGEIGTAKTEMESYTNSAISDLNISEYAKKTDIDSAKTELIGSEDTISAQTIQAGVKEAEEYADGKITALNIGDYAKTTDMQAADQALEQKLLGESQKEATATTIKGAVDEAETYTDTKISELGTTYATKAEVKALKLNDIQANGEDNYVIFDCGSATVMVEKAES